MKRITKALTVTLFLGTLFVAEAVAGTYTASSCNRIDVNAAINTAVDGDTIIIPAGSCTWTSGISVPAGIGITITGSGTPNSTPSTAGASASCSNTTITANGSWVPTLFTMSPQYGNSTMRLSCMKLLPSGGTSGSSPVTIHGTCTVSGCPNFRLDNITAPSSWGSITISDQAFAIVGDVFGVADHNTIGDTTPTGIYIDFLNLGHGRWQGVGGYGDKSFASPDTFGTNQAFYAENNIFRYTMITDTDIPTGDNSGGGARAVCRFNSLPVLQIFGACSGHGTETTGRNRGGRQFEVYNNTATCIDTQQGCGSFSAGRSGVQITFGNVITNSGGGFFKGMANFDTQRTWRASSWGYCDGTNVYDYNSGGVAVVCLDQANRGQGILMQNNPAVLTTTGSPGWPQQVLDPSYEFMDTMPGTADHTLSSNTSMIVANRDYYAEGINQATQTSPTSPFNGTSGVGHGTLANRPTTCTPNPHNMPFSTGAPGVGYWATDQGNWNQSGSGGQGQLYVCTATNTWALYYTPYTYPHPLTQGSSPTPTSPAPTGLQVLVQ